MADEQTESREASIGSPASVGGAFGAARDIVLIVGMNGEILDANDAAAHAYGYDRGALLGMSIVQLRNSAAQSVAPEQMREAAEHGVLFESVHRRSDGTAFPVEVSSSAIELGGKTALVSVIRDISQRRNRERALKVLLESSEESNRRLEVMLRLLSNAVSAENLDSIFDGTVAIVSELMNTEIALFLVAEDDSMRVRAQVGASEWTPAGYLLGPGEGFASQVRQARRPVHVADVAASDVAIAAHAGLGIRSMLGVPVLIEGELFGVLECAWTSIREVDDAECTMLELAAERIATAISRARLLEHTRRAERLTRAVNEISDHLNATLDIKEAIEPALQIAAGALDCDVALYCTSRDGMWCVDHMWGTGKVPERARIDADLLSGGAADTEPTIIRAGHPALDALADYFGIGSALAIPFRGRRDHAGAILIGSLQPDAVFDDPAIEFAMRISHTVSVALSNALHFETEHRIAEALQEALLTVPDRVAGIEFAHLYQSATLATRVGGDFFDVFEMADDRVGVLIGDVSGKGLEAAVLTSIIKDTIRAYAHEALSPAEVIAKANVILERAATLPDFATVFFGVLHCCSGALSYCCAGHPPAAVLGVGGRVRMLECGSPVIGAFADLDYVDHVAQIDAGEIVFLYTDGITESRRLDREFFGDMRLTDVLVGAAGADVCAVPGIAFDAVMGFADGMLSDDVAILALRRS